MSAMEAASTSSAVTDRFADQMDGHRRELNAYCYRMLGSGSEAEDAVQETFLRAWRAREGFEGRASLRSWLYRIATNVCLDMPQRPQRRARPMDLVSPSTTESAVLRELPEHAWVQPVPDHLVFSRGGDPAELTAQRETLRLAFVAALQTLPPRQRVALILREVLHWQASEVAELLQTTTASVNSALQRARATLDEAEPEDELAPLDAAHEQLVTQYMNAFEKYDIEALVVLLRDDVRYSMPPYELWLNDPVEVGQWMLGPGKDCRGARLVATHANGCPAFGSYRADPAGGHKPFSIQVLELSGGQIAGIHNYLNTELFEHFGLPPRLDG
jgi:RNA polymerase sigma-70 factor (ECF subfamily)